MIPYFYIIKSSTGFMYAGSRTSKHSNPKELLVTYKTSSNIVKKMISNGVNFTVQQIITFEKPEHALNYEKYYLLKNNCVYRDDWLNVHDGNVLAPFGSPSYKRLLESKYGNIDNISQVANISSIVSKALTGSINVWDEHEKRPVRILTEYYKNNRERYWHFSSKDYISKYDKKRTTKKPGGSTLYRLHDAAGNIHIETLYFEDYCITENLPYVTFRASAKAGGKPIYTKKPPNKKEWLKYKGWFATVVVKQ